MQPKRWVGHSPVSVLIPMEVLPALPLPCIMVPPWSFLVVPGTLLWVLNLSCRYLVVHAQLLNAFHTRAVQAFPNCHLSFSCHKHSAKSLFVSYKHARIFNKQDWSSAALSLSCDFVRVIWASCRWQTMQLYQWGTLKRMNWSNATFKYFGIKHSRTYFPLNIISILFRSYNLFLLKLGPKMHLYAMVSTA